MLSKLILNAFFFAFKPAEEISFSEIDPAMDRVRFLDPYA